MVLSRIVRSSGPKVISEDIDSITRLRTACLAVLWVESSSTPSWKEQAWTWTEDITDVIPGCPITTGTRIKALLLKVEGERGRTVVPGDPGERRRGPFRGRRLGLPFFLDILAGEAFGLITCESQQSSAKETRDLLVGNGYARSGFDLILWQRRFQRQNAVLL